MFLHVCTFVFLFYWLKKLSPREKYKGLGPITIHHEIAYSFFPVWHAFTSGLSGRNKCLLDVINNS